MRLLEALGDVGAWARCHWEYWAYGDKQRLWNIHMALKEIGE